MVFFASATITVSSPRNHPYSFDHCSRFAMLSYTKHRTCMKEPLRNSCSKRNRNIQLSYQNYSRPRASNRLHRGQAGSVLRAASVHILSCLRGMAHFVPTTPQRTPWNSRRACSQPATSLATSSSTRLPRPSRMSPSSHYPTGEKEVCAMGLFTEVFVLSV